MSHYDITQYQQEFLTSDSRIVCMVCGLGVGKTWIAAESCVQGLSMGGHIIVVSQSYKSLSLVLMAEILEHLRHHNIEYKYNKSSMIIDIPSTGGRVMGFSADSVESVRGTECDWLILDEAAIMNKYVYEVCSGRVRRGKLRYKVMIVTTPRGKNWIYDLCMRKDVHYIKASTYMNPFLPKEYIEQLKLEYDEEFSSQELDGNFVDVNVDNQLIFIEDIKGARLRSPTHIDDAQCIAGLDVARFGGDNSYLIIRKGNQVLFKKRWQGLPLTQLSREVINVSVNNHIDILVVDGVGVGAGVVDTLKEKLIDINVVEFNGAFKAQRADKYANLRTESWVLMRNWLRDCGSIELTDDESSDFTEMTYMLNTKNKMLLKSKDALRSQGKSSPDLADALSMTFASYAKKSSTAIKKALNKKRKR